MEKKYIVALEIGSSRIKGAIGTYDTSNNTLTVLSVENEKLTGDEMSNAVRYGLVQNVDKVGECVDRIRRKLENSASVAPHKIKSVYAAIGGRSLYATACEVSHNFPEERRITDEVVASLKEEARGQNISDNEVLDVVPRSFVVDGTTTTNPVGMFGKSIKATMMLITCKPTASRNLRRAIEECSGLKINSFIVRPLAEANMVLTDDEKRLGCMLVDFGAETVSVAIYKGGALVYLAVLPIGSRNITRDLMALGNHTEERADDIKRTTGNLEPLDAAKRALNPDKLDYSRINDIVAARAGEIIANIMEQIRYADLTAADLPGGIVLVGRGARLKGFTTVLANQTKLKVRIGTHSGLISIMDGRVQSDDSVDVLSLLAEASRKPDLAECTIVERPQVTVETEADDIDDDDLEDDETSRVGDDLPGFKETRRERKERERRRKEEEKRKKERQERKKAEAERRRKEMERLRAEGEYALDDENDEDDPEDDEQEEDEPKRGGFFGRFRGLKDRIVKIIDDNEDDSYSDN